MWSMWNTPSECDYYDPFGLDCDEDEAEICADCGARWDRGEACGEWCAKNRAEPEPAPVSCGLERLLTDEMAIVPVGALLR